MFISGGKTTGQAAVVIGRDSQPGSGQFCTDGRNYTSDVSHAVARPCLHSHSPSFGDVKVCDASQPEHRFDPHL